jgi:hypothetical protein
VRGLLSSVEDVWSMLHGRPSFIRFLENGWELRAFQEPAKGSVIRAFTSPS